ncbi:hypothetical protein [Ferruginibacter paludis]|uniref:hypothetical protein n=1 Tax=Ferruginibacter paludis TaxID=1310417 RepID=UPI00338D8BF8
MIFLTLVERKISNFYYLITLFWSILSGRLKCLLIEFNKRFILFHKAYFSVMFWLIKYVFTYLINIRLRYGKG